MSNKENDKKQLENMQKLSQNLKEEAANSSVNSQLRDM